MRAPTAPQAPLLHCFSRAIPLPGYGAFFCGFIGAEYSSVQYAQKGPMPRWVQPPSTATKTLRLKKNGNPHTKVLPSPSTGLLPPMDAAAVWKDKLSTPSSTKLSVPELDPSAELLVALKRSGEVGQKKLAE